MSTKGSPFKQRKYYQGHLTILGDANVGKTQLINRFIEDSFNENYRPTATCKYESRNLHFSEQSLYMTLTDTCGSGFLETIQNGNLKQADAAFLLFAIDDPKALEILEMLLINFQALSYGASRPILLIGTKSDLRSSARTEGGERLISYDEVEAFAKDHGLEYIETSAKDGKNVLKIFEMIAKEIIKMKDEKKKEYQANQTKTSKSLGPSESICSIF